MKLIVHIFQRMHIPNDVWDMIADFAATFEVIPWIKLTNLHWNSSSHNTNAIDLLEKYINKIDCYLLSRYPNTINVLKKYLDKIDCDCICENPNAITLLEKYPNNIN